VSKVGDGDPAARPARQADDPSKLQSSGGETERAGRAFSDPYFGLSSPYFFDGFHAKQ